MSKLFVLSRSYYEEATNYYFMGPDEATEESFNALCYSLLDDAARLALSNARQSHDGKIYVSDVVELLIPLLKKQGYQLFDPPRVSFFGNPLTHKDPFIKNFSIPVSNEIINYNRKFERKYRENK